VGTPVPDHPRLADGRLPLPNPFRRHPPDPPGAIAYARQENLRTRPLPTAKPCEYFKNYTSRIRDPVGGNVLRTTSLSPVNTPWDIGMALPDAPQTAVDYASPLPLALYHTLNREITTSSGETKKVGYAEAAKRNILGRLAPSAAFIQEEISPPSGKDRIYPDTSRLGRLTREAGVVPVTIGKDAAQRASFKERGMDQSVGVLSHKQELFDRIDQAGEKPSKALIDAYQMKLDRAKYLDRIQAGGARGLTYQQKAYQADIAYLRRKNLISASEAAETLRHAKNQNEATLKRWRGWLGDNKFQGNVISEASY
jgi:hypothetical protein